LGFFVSSRRKTAANAAGIETAAHSIPENGGGIERELSDGVEIMRELATTENPELKLVAKRVQVVGAENVKRRRFVNKKCGT
jgi:hypothetical protein